MNMISNFPVAQGPACSSSKSSNKSCLIEEPSSLPILQTESQFHLSPVPLDLACETSCSFDLEVCRSSCRKYQHTAILDCTHDTPIPARCRRTATDDKSDFGKCL